MRDKQEVEVVDFLLQVKDCVVRSPHQDIIITVHCIYTSVKIIS